MSMSDLELLQLVETVKEKQKGPQGDPGVGIVKIDQFDDTSFTITLTNGYSKKISLPPAANGEPGPVGPEGRRGEPGPAGSPGRDGAPGTAGADGQDGAPGVAIETAVINGNDHLLLGLTDDTIIDVGRVVGPAGETGERGPAGLPGEPGSDGAAVLSGPRAPQQSDGEEGDHWIDISSAEFGFYKKNGDGWAKLANLRQPATDRAVPATGGGTATTKVDSTNVNLKRGARSGNVPKFVDLPKLANQMQFNWFTENQLNIDRTEIIQNQDEIKKLKAVQGIPHIYTLKDEVGGSVTTGEFSTNSAVSANVTEIKISALSVDGTPLPIAKQGDSLVLERRSDGQTARYVVTTVTSATQFGVEFESETSTDVLTVGGEYDVFLFPTATTPVVVSATEPTSPALGDLWFNVNAGDDLFVLFIWDGTAWRSVPLPPSMQTVLDTKLDLAGGDMTGQLKIKKPRAETGANNSFVILGNIGGAEDQVVLKDYRYGKNDGGGDALVQYFGGTYSPKAIANVEYVTGYAMKKDGSNAASNVQLQSATLSQNLTVEGSSVTKSVFTVDRPLVSVASNSFIIKGSIGNTENQSVFYDYRDEVGSGLGTRMIYKGPISQPDEIVTKSYVDARSLPYSTEEFNAKIANLEALVETLQNRVAELESAA